LRRLSNSGPVILPSLLLCDFGDLKTEVRRLADAGIQALHLDVMDGHFVDNLSYGLPLVEGVRKLTDMYLDVHLMIECPEHWVSRYRAAGADGMTVHVEATSDPVALLRQIRTLGASAGISLNPDTPVTAVEACLTECDLVLPMSVYPGFGGQTFLPSALEKLQTLRAHGPADLLLEVDGGINLGTTASCRAAGAQLFVVGSAIFGQADYAACVRALLERAAAGNRPQ
jgi:ribulose-phosphate 3-epimerase